MTQDQRQAMIAVAICYKPYLKPREAEIYCSLSRTQLLQNLADAGVEKTSTGYYRKADLDRMMEGDTAVNDAANSVVNMVRNNGERSSKRVANL